MGLSSRFTSTRQTGARPPTCSWARCCSGIFRCNAAGQGVTILAEAVVNDAHTLYLIEAGSQDQVEGFIGPVRPGRDRGGPARLAV